MSRKGNCRWEWGKQRRADRQDGTRKHGCQEPEAKDEAFCDFPVSHLYNPVLLIIVLGRELPRPPTPARHWATGGSPRGCPMWPRAVENPPNDGYSALWMSYLPTPGRYIRAAPDRHFGLDVRIGLHLPSPRRRRSLTQRNMATTPLRLSSSRRGLGYDRDSGSHQYRCLVLPIAGQPGLCVRVLKAHRRPSGRPVRIFAMDCP